jgi:hypothetical protein
MIGERHGGLPTACMAYATSYGDLDWLFPRHKERVVVVDTRETGGRRSATGTNSVEILSVQCNRALCKEEKTEEN